MSECYFYVEKNTDQMRSTLVAVGLASLLSQLAPDGSGLTVRLCDLGSAYQLQVNRDLEALRADIAERGLPVLLPAIHKPLSAGEKKQLEAGVPEAEVLRKYVPIGFRSDRVIDYGKLKALPEAGRKQDGNRQEGDTDVRPPDFPLWAHLCSYFGKGSAMRTGYPLVVHAWHAHQGACAPALFDLIAAAYSDFPNALDEARERWRTELKPQLNYADFEIFGWKKADSDVSTLSIVSPTTAQGSYTNNGARPLNNGTPDTFWLEMYLAFAGYIIVGMPYNAGGDVLLYYPIPRDISFDALRAMMEDYRASAHVRELYGYSNLFPRAKIDALSQIAFYEAMTRHYRAHLGEARRFTRRIDSISGVVGYYYKDISTQIPFDETTFALPPWLPLRADAAALDATLQTLEQHHDLIRVIRGDYAEELALLTAYRRFITLGTPMDWIDFAAAYGQHRFQKMVDSGWLKPLHQNLVVDTLLQSAQETNLMEPRTDYRTILETPGFRNLANAINYCTVYLRYIKDVKNQSSAFKVRHGLGDDLLRHAHNDREFLVHLTEFIHDYLRESSNVQANTGETRPWITTDDIADITDLVHRYGARIVAGMLVASGYAQKPRNTEPAQ